MIDLYLICEDFKNKYSELKQNHVTCIKRIYNTLLAPSHQTEQIISEWKKNFNFIYGDINTNLSSNGKLNIKTFFEKYGIQHDSEQMKNTELLFFALQTYYSIFIKCFLKKILDNKQSKFCNAQNIILGEFALNKGINNFSNIDFYIWPLFELKNSMQSVIQDIYNSFESYESDTSLTEFLKENNADYIKHLYEMMIPKEIRHALGEYYTPEWLVQEVLETAQEFYDKNDSKFIDPTCGSGTFLSQIISYKRKNNSTLQEIQNTVKGIDINPLAVLTAKTNYILAVLDLVNNNSNFEIPVYNADIINKQVSEDVCNKVSYMENPQKAILNNFIREQISVNNLEPFDFVIGNPPWVNWEYLPEEYRKKSQHLWVDYNLFSAKGRDLSFSKEDISVLITYLAIDKLLKKNGILAFVIRQGIFKSAQNGVGFRRFKIGEEELRVLRVDDLSNLKAFNNATTNTAIIYLKKGEKNSYPVPYILWQKRDNLKSISLSAGSQLVDLKPQITLIEQVATPTIKQDKTSIWMTAKANELEDLLKTLGTNTYKARTGIFTGGANAVYWLDVYDADNNYISVTNIVDHAKRKAPKISATIEKEYVFPMLKGSNIRKWNVSYDSYLLCPHTAETKMWPIRYNQLRTNAPKTTDYLEQFKSYLDQRKGFAGWEKEIQAQEFHAILRVGEYTFSKYKVVWKYIAREFICAVISTVEDKFLGTKMLLPNEKVMYISTDNEAEAYYLCGILSSTPIANSVKSYMNPTSISAHVLNKLNIPSFDANNRQHIEIAEICKSGHSKSDIKQHISQIDKIVMAMYL